jgi:hypothetical protein
VSAPIASSGCTVVGKHHRNQNRLVGDRRFELGKIDTPVALHRQIGNLKSVFFKPLASVEYRLVLGHCGDDVIAFVPVEFGNSLQRQVVRFSCAGRENNFFFTLRADERGDALARILNSFFGSPAERMISACCIAKLGSEIGQHLVDHARVGRRSGVIVHKDWKLQGHGRSSA